MGYTVKGEQAAFADWIWNLGRKKKKESRVTPKVSGWHWKVTDAMN